MEPGQYQGLFYLASGAGAFFTLLLGFRALGERDGAASEESDGSDWVAMEKLEVAERIEECEAVVTLRLKRKAGRPLPPFKAGQFLTVQIGSDEKCTRSYSISSSAVNRFNLQVSVKKLNGGRGSGWVHDLNVGDELWAYPPSGLFTDAELDGSSPIVYVAGGIGITPIYSMIQTNIDMSRDTRMVLIYGMRTERDMAFHEALSVLAARHPRFKYHPVLSHPAGGWLGERGFVDLEFVRGKVKDLTGAHFFLCGPAVMTGPLMGALEGAGVPENQLHEERFASPATVDRKAVPRRAAKVTYQGSAYDYDGNETLLEFFEGKGVHLPFACRVGVCGSCKCRASGQLESLTDAGLTRAERQSGYVLACVAFPTGDCQVE